MNVYGYKTPSVNEATKAKFERLERRKELKDQLTKRIGNLKRFIGRPDSVDENEFFELCQNAFSDLVRLTRTQEYLSRRHPCEAMEKLREKILAESLYTEESLLNEQYNFERLSKERNSKDCSIFG